MLLKGAAVAKSINAWTSEKVARLKELGCNPCLAIMRMGERPDDIAYEKAAVKRCEQLGITVKTISLSSESATADVLKEIEKLNRDESVHGVLIMRPMPRHIDDEAVRMALLPQKDVDGITEGSLAGVFCANEKGFAPCTAQACIELLLHYNIKIEGSRAVVIGRSLVIGKPVAMLLLSKNATVTICHTKTDDLPAVCKEADILVAAAGKAGVVDAACVSAGQTVIDVGIQVNDEGSMCGDVKFDKVCDIAGAITPVPGGVGSVTTAVLAKHVVVAAERSLCKEG